MLIRIFSDFFAIFSDFFVILSKGFERDFRTRNRFAIHSKDFERGIDFQFTENQVFYLQVFLRKVPVAPLLRLGSQCCLQA